MNIISYPYLWQNQPNKKDPQEWIGLKPGGMCDPNKTHAMIEKTHPIFKKMAALDESLESRRAFWTKPIRYILQLFAPVQTLKAAKCWAKVKEAFVKSDWETALEQLQKLNHRKEKEAVIRFPFASFEDFSAKSGINPRENLFAFTVL